MLLYMIISFYSCCQLYNFHHHHHPSESIDQFSPCLFCLAHWSFDCSLSSLYRHFLVNDLPLLLLSSLGLHVIKFLVHLLSVVRAVWPAHLYLACVIRFLWYYSLICSTSFPPICMLSLATRLVGFLGINI